MLKYILRGKKVIPITDPVIWSQWLERADRRVKKDKCEGYEISTVFLGLDHNFSSKGPPLLFETMIFTDFKSAIDCKCWRYSTWDEAVKGHEAAIEFVKDFIKG